MITTERNTFIGAHVTEEEKELVRRISRENGGMSKWLHRLIRAELQRLGHQLSPEAK